MSWPPLLLKSSWTHSSESAKRRILANEKFLTKPTILSGYCTSAVVIAAANVDEVVFIIFLLLLLLMLLLLVLLCSSQKKTSMLIRIPLAKIIFAQVELLAAKYVDCRHYHDYLLGHLPFGRNGTLTFMQTSSRGLVEIWQKLFLLVRWRSQQNEFVF